jgi:S1-C subfamily serine protease
VSASGASPETSSAPSDEPPQRGGGFVRRRRVWLTGLIVLVVLLGGGLYAATRDSSPPPLDQADVNKIASNVAKKAIENLQSAPAQSAVAYQQILPSLVEIETERASSDGDDASGLGAGVIINANGSIMTALHVVDGATSIRVSFVDGTRASATVVSTDPKNDIAVLQPEQNPETIVPAVLGGGGQVGDTTFAVGHPLGFAGSLSSGVISGLNRSVTVKSGKKLTGLIQFDAAVNPGNSGGPLLDRNGQVIGIVTALANPSRDGYFIGLGFAVPIGTAGGAGNVPQK